MKVTESNALYSLTREGKAQADWETRGEAGRGGAFCKSSKMLSLLYSPLLFLIPGKVFLLQKAADMRGHALKLEMLYLSS